MSNDKNTTGNDAPVMDHDYDGIQEFDNPLPMWWLTTFFVTIIFGFVYWIHYSFGGGPSLADELKTELSVVEAAKKKNPAPLESEQMLVALLTDKAALEKGQVVYSEKCLACHGPQLQGLIGPNLTDDFWIHGKGKAVDIALVVRKGVLEKGMPPWEGQLTDEQIRAVTAYVASQRGTNPPKAKAPQGERVVSN
jgi:cytochrome c oxidase cbb3-type subunit 3